MELEYAKKFFFLKWFKVKIALKKNLPRRHPLIPAGFDVLMHEIRQHKKIVVLASGPSAKRLRPTSDGFYLVTNDSYKIVADLEFLYYIKDGYFVNRFLANGPYSEKHSRTLFYWISGNINDEVSLQQFLKRQRLPAAHELYFFSDLVSSTHSETEWKRFYDFITEQHKLPFKIQNSGIFLLFLGFYLAAKLNMPLEIYGLDLGVGGNFHFDKKGHISDSITRDSVKRNVKVYLDEIYKSLGGQVKNHSNYCPN